MNSELYHHGIKGQKWGIRRYQNEDGTLTDAGKKRYGAHVEKVSKKKLLDQMNRHVKTGNSKATDVVMNRWKKAESLAEKSEVGKKLYTVSNYMQELGPDVLYTKNFFDEYNALINDTRKIATDYMNEPKFRDKIASMYLNELGYDDTTVGREYVKEIMGEFRYA